MKILAITLARGGSKKIKNKNIKLLNNKPLIWYTISEAKKSKYIDDYIVSTGVDYSIRDFLNIAFNHIGINDWSKYVGIDQKFMRPAEVDVLNGDSSKIQSILGWKPKTSFEELVKKMVDSDLQKLSK